MTLIFLEVLRDSGASTEQHTVTHELGHAGRDDDNDVHQPTGIMMEGGYKAGEDSFDDATKGIIRGKEVW